MRGKIYKSKMWVCMLAAVKCHLIRLPCISNILPRSLFFGCNGWDKLRYVYCGCIGVLILIYCGCIGVFILMYCGCTGVFILIYCGCIGVLF